MISRRFFRWFGGCHAPSPGNTSPAAAIAMLTFVLIPAACLLAEDVPQFGLYERSFRHAGRYENPYVELTAEAEFTEPDGAATRTVPLFWDGEKTWKFRFSPERAGTWRWKTTSTDRGLAGHTGSFRVVPSNLKGSIRPMRDHPGHFERQDGSPFWFMGDTAWALYTDNAAEKHDRASVINYIDTRAAQGFNVLHSMLLSESGWGNRGGPPFENIGAEIVNPGYWQEVDHRLGHLNRRGMIAGLALAWGDKRGVLLGDEEPFAWKRLASIEAKRRYARYIAARYSAYNVYFLVSGEWHAEVRATRGATEASIKREFIEIGDTLRANDPHHRMIAIHPMTAHGSVREFVGTGWMTFGDYQQNYRQLHGRVLRSRRANLPVVNSEYAYYLRDRDGDGLVDKPNSFDLQSIRHATWDIVMGGGYFVTGFGTTYFGGNRDPGPFDVEAAKNDDWEEDVQHAGRLLKSLDWWKLSPADDAITAGVERGSDGTRRAELGGRRVSVIAPPKVAYWLLADLGHTYVAYVRGHDGPFRIQIGDRPTIQETGGTWRLRQFDPRTGTSQDLGIRASKTPLEYRPPDSRDWLLVIRRN